MSIMMMNSTRRKQSRPNRHPEDDDDDEPQQQLTVPVMSETTPATSENSIEQGVKMKTSECSVIVEEKNKMKKNKKIESGEDKIMISGHDTFEEDGDEDVEEPVESKGDDYEPEFEPPEVSRFDDLDDEGPLMEELSGEPPLKLESREGSAEKDSDESPELEKESLQAALQNLMVDFHWPEGTSITIERVESTKAAVAELTAAAIQSSTTDYSSASLQDLALIQSTLFTLQQQQIVQLQLVQQLLAQLAMCTDGELDESMQECSSEPGSPMRESHENDSENQSSTRRKEPEKNGNSDNKAPAGSISSSETLSSKFASLFNCGGNQDPNRPLSPGLAAQSSLNAILMPDDNNGGTTSSLNTLEMLTKRAQEVLDSASQGLLASSLVDDSYKKGGGGLMDKREPFFKHRCRYCGKVFGSDSALQIHIRSHTGERPYKCNVCGSRFTTKGNLKVHFQRHSQKFPHVKMNPHPVPEHLDHFHPPILASGERSPDLVPTNLPFGPVPPAAAFTPMNFMRFDNPAAAAAAAAAAKLSLGFPLGREAIAAAASLEPEDLSKAKSKSKRAINEDEERMRREESRERSPTRFDDDEDDEDFDDENDEDDEPRDVEMSEEKLRSGEQPENLSSKSLPLMHSIPLQATTRPARPSSASKISRSRRDSQSPGSKESLDKMDDLSLMDITKDPRSYAALLPRPGSASSAWESLIEVNTSSETSKLQQLVDNIDNQISDPNECVVCHRVLSCKSALQMHYRTHTGERPFKCRLCGRAFTTKGNLKTHMGVHRIKEGDTHHQCPVCHKRFTTQLVLQQHIRLHTGEPTELTFDQIRAGEIRDFIPNFASPGSSSNSAAGISPFVSPPKDSRDTTTPGSAGSSGAAAAAAALFPEDLSKKVSSGPSTPSMLHAAPPSRNSAQSPAADTTDSELSSSEWGGGKQSESDTRATPPSASTTPGGGHPSHPFLPLDLTPKNSIFSPFLPNLNPLMGNSALSSLANSVLNSTAAFNPMHMNVIAGRGATRGNTTCGLCFKTFACHSALEIHYRSHTKERPFKCTVCDRGFSTKGNMKQHMLTHKIRDMPAGAFDPSKLGSQNSNSSACSSISSAAPVKIPEFGAAAKPATPPSSKDLCEREMDEPPKKEHNIRDHAEESESRASGHHMVDDENSRSSIGGSTKHMCHVCQKGFSSSSSLHIHMRTHTGDKPFKCNVCQKAFTTKGNLKVHMGTHMWTSGASRRGRRMSLELPLGLQFNPHHHQAADGRHFFPFVPPNFPGGPVNLAATKLVDYSLLRPPMQFPPGMIPTSAGPMIIGGAGGSKDEKEEPHASVVAAAAAEDDDDNDDAGSDT